MSLGKLEPLLQKCALDRETKLQIIDLIAHAKDEASINELIERISVWRQADDESVKQLIDQIIALRENYAQQVEQLEKQGTNKTLELADEIAREEKIQLTRDRILNQI